MRWTLGLALLLAGCGGNDTDGSTAGSDDSGADTTALDCNAATWEDDRGEAYMTHCVVPEMGALFQDFDADAYGDFSCTNCHGDDLGGGTYSMPSAPPISVRQQDPTSAIYQFMNGTVVPEMAALLGREPYDPSTGQGDFSCHDCHIEG